VGSRPFSKVAAGLVALFTLGSAAPAHAQWQIESKDGKSNIKVGFLAQPQFETAQTSDSGSPTGGTVDAKNLFLRRFRILFGGKVSEKWTFFFETDSPNLGKQAAGTVWKDTGTIYIQDAFVTYNHGDAFKIDAGMILVVQSHNNGQSAATLLPIDYGPYTFVDAGPLQERVGRDYGVQARGYPLGQHVEYRLGVFQGIRGEQSRNGMRVSGRAVWYPFAADTAFFYGGTFQGTRRIVGIGANVDTQSAPGPLATPLAATPAKKNYTAFGIDAFAEQPIHLGAQAVTAQFNWVRFDGGTLAPALAAQNTYLVEGGVHFGRGRYTPFFQYARRDFVDSPLLANTSYWQAGFAWWMAAHQRNLKLSAGRSHVNHVGASSAIDRTQVLAQLQIFFY
jgi:hypothetical protein